MWEMGARLPPRRSERQDGRELGKERRGTYSVRGCGNELDRRHWAKLATAEGF